MSNLMIRTGASFALLAVIFGAFGAHALKNIVDAYSIDIWNKGVFYQFIHAVALMMAGVMASQLSYKHLRTCAVLFTTGILLFSGSLYILSFSKVTTQSLQWIGPLTPIGGMAFIAGWFFILLASWEKQPVKKHSNNI